MTVTFIAFNKQTFLCLGSDIILSVDNTEEILYYVLDDEDRCSAQGWGSLYEGVQ